VLGRSEEPEFVRPEKTNRPNPIIPKNSYSSTAKFLNLWRLVSMATSKDSALSKTTSFPTLGLEHAAGQHFFVDGSESLRVNAQPRSSSRYIG
jgi:hypothetical protein